MGATPEGQPDETADECRGDEAPTDLAGRRRRTSGTAGGLIRRVRRRLDVSQRGLADLLGVEASRVARWETGRTPPGVGELEAVLALADLRLVAIDAEDDVVEPMAEDAVRDRGGRRYPAHADLRTAGWWIAPTSWLTARTVADERRSAMLGEAQIHYDLGWLRDAVRHFYGVPHDHPTRARIVADLRKRDAERDARRDGQCDAPHRRAC